MGLKRLGQSGRPVGPMRDATPVVVFTLYRLLYRSVAYTVPLNSAATPARLPSPVAPITETAPVAGFTASRFPDSERLRSFPFDPGINPNIGSAITGPIALNVPAARSIVPNWPVK